MQSYPWLTLDTAATPSCSINDSTGTCWHPRYAWHCTTAWLTSQQKDRLSMLFKITCPNNMHTPPCQIPDTPPAQQLALSVPVVHTTLSCGLQSSASKQRRLRLVDTNLKCPGPHTQRLDPASMVHALWNYKRNKARSFSAWDAVNTIYFYDMQVISIDDWRFVPVKPRDKSWR